MLQNGCREITDFFTVTVGLGNWNAFAASRAASHCRQEAQTKIRNDLFKRYGVEIDRAAIREFTTGANSAAAVKPADKADATPEEKAEARPQQ